MVSSLGWPLQFLSLERFAIEKNVSDKININVGGVVPVLN
jgi:hypothetical protein